MLAYGPVPSRRFGRSLGMNNIPPKRCTYSCIYCQLGPTNPMRVRRRPYHPVREMADAVAERGFPRGHQSGTRLPGRPDEAPGGG